MKKKNILIIGSSQGCYGGIEAFMIALAEAVDKWPEFKVKLCFKLVYGANKSDELERSAKNVCDQMYFVRRGSWDLFKLIWWANVLHVQNTPPDVILIGAFLRKRIFLTIHSWRRKKFNLRSLLTNISIKFSERRWYISDFVWSTWEPVNKLSKSTCVPTISRLPKTWCPPEKRKGFLFIGRWIPNKGIEELLQAYALINLDSAKWPLTILGDGPLKSKILSLTEQFALNNVFMPGFVNESDKAKYISSCKWLLAPAQTKEELGLTPIEARSVGVPAIVTRDGGLPEAGGPSALIAEPGNIEDLARCMNIAASMNEDEYKLLGELASNSLKGFLKPIDFYRQAYNGE